MIAIVGMACRYPDARTPGELWQNVLARRRAFRRVPACRLSESYRGDHSDPDLSYVTHAAVLRDWEFDRERFGVPGPLYRAADHTHWLALETAANALADAGFPDGAGLDHLDAGVILGNSLTGEFSRACLLRQRWPFIADAAATAMAGAGVSEPLAGQVLASMEQLVKQPFPVPGDETLAGALANTIAGRICNHFDFHGTGYTVDGACSSSLLAVITACRALTSGDCSFMLAGGVDMSLDPFEMVGFSRLGALAESEMRVYDEHPTGFLPGEGCGVVALMRAGDADRLGLRVYGRITGWGSSCDGAGGLTRPTCDGQVLALRRAYRMAGTDAAEIGLVEGHGTGTAVGDPVELEALGRVRAQGRPAAIGSVKANIGHTKAAAGVAGLIKATLAAYHGVLPPTTGCRLPHRLLRESRTLRTLTDPEPWTGPTPKAGVSSMGFGGINAHVVVEGSGTAPSCTDVSFAEAQRWARRFGPPEIVLVGARGPTELADRLRTVAAVAAQLGAAEVRDVAATAWRVESTAPFRAALVAGTPDELAAVASAAREACAGWDGSARLDWRRGHVLGAEAITTRIGLLFPGQAAPVRSGRPWWAEHGDGPGVESRGIDFTGETDTAVAQPAIVRQELHGLAWLRALGTEAVAAVGHSLGELTALHWAGALTAADVLSAARIRGLLMAEHGETDTSMAALAASPQRVAELLRGTDVVIAAFNAPTQVTVSGRAEDLATVVDRARIEGISATPLPVSHGFHSAAMLPVCEPLREALREFRFGKISRPLVSTVTGGVLTGEDPVELLVGQLTAPVRFSDALAELADRCDLLVEVGPGAILTDIARAGGHTAVSMDCGGDPRRHAFVTAVLAACAGADLTPWFADRPHRELPVDVVPRFVPNPCESREGWSTAKVPAQPPAVAEVPAGLDRDPLSALTAHLARTLELSARRITADTGLLADLHLTSLQVAQAVGEVAAALGKQAPSAPLSLADGTVGDVADVLRALPETDAGAEHVVPGVRGWVRHFITVWVPHEGGPAPAVEWQVDAPRGHWLHSWTGRGETRGLAVVMTEDTDVALLLAGLADQRPERLLIVHDGHPAAHGVARSAAVELDRCAVTVADLADGCRIDPALTTDATGSRYLELRAGVHCAVERAQLRVTHPGTGAPPVLGENEICLVTGGIRGITAYVAAALAERTGCTLVFAGRTPAEDPEVTAALDDLRQRVEAHYVRCDVTDTGSVGELLAVAWRYGEIRGLLHGAGINEPRTLSRITSESLRRTTSPKVDGLRNLLDAAGGGLRLVLGFGSIIGRQGLPGQAEYCVANDWMRVELERWAAIHPSCRTHALEWSVWSGIGMGVRLDVLDSLRRQGVDPIGPDEGTAALHRLLDDPDAPVSVLITSRFPSSPTITFGGTGEMFRFTETQRVRTPGVEAVTEARLSLGADPYLDDHRIDGTAVLPAVVGMEAMAQVAALTGPPAKALTGIEFRTPIVVDQAEGRTLQLAALADARGVDVVLRDGNADRFVARCEPAGPQPGRRAPAAPPDDLVEPHPCYRDLMFHSGRFRRLAGYDVLSAFRVEAWIRADAAQRWFSDFHSPALVLGDPGAHDATLHVLLACVPHRRALPVGVDRMTVWREPDGLLRVLAREIAHTADEYLFDVDLVDRHGVVFARWQGLRLRAIGAVRWDAGMRRDLFGPWLSRRLIECGLADGIELFSTHGTRSGGSAAALAARLAGRAWHDAAGALHVGGRHVSASYTRENLLLAVADIPIGVDWESVPDSRAELLPAILGAGDRQTAEVLAEKVGEDLTLAAAHVWSAREALTKLGREQNQPLRVDQVTDDGIAVAHAGGVQVVTTGMRIPDAGAVVVAAVATGRRER